MTGRSFPFGDEPEPEEPRAEPQPEAQQMTEEMRAIVVPHKVLPFAAPSPTTTVRMKRPAIPPADAAGPHGTERMPAIVHRGGVWPAPAPEDIDAALDETPAPWSTPRTLVIALIVALVVVNLALAWVVVTRVL